MTTAVDIRQTLAPWIKRYEDGVGWYCTNPVTMVDMAWRLQHELGVNAQRLSEAASADPDAYGTDTTWSATWSDDAQLLRYCDLVATISNEV